MRLRTASYDKSGRPAELTLHRLELFETLESPAVSVSAMFMCTRHPGDLATLEVANGSYFFQGEIDKQRVGLSGRGMTVTIDARSPAALLLDNEAMPGAYANVGLDTVFFRHIVPYGFILNRLVPDRRLALYNVHKGNSEWGALTEFTLRAYGLAPRIQGKLVHIGPLPPAGTMRISNNSGIPFTELTADYIPYNIISRVMIQDENGEYSSGMDNPQAGGIRRVRYHIPAGEFASHANMDADRRIKMSMADSKSWSITLPGIIDVSLGMGVDLDAPGFHGPARTVSAWSWRVGPEGMYTVLRLTQ